MVSRYSQGTNTFYITGKGFRRAVPMLSDELAHPHNLYSNVLTFVATSRDSGVTPEFYWNELGRDEGVDIGEVRRVLHRLEDDGMITHWKSGRSKRADRILEEIGS